MNFRKNQGWVTKKIDTGIEVGRNYLLIVYYEDLGSGIYLVD